MKEAEIGFGTRAIGTMPEVTASILSRRHKGGAREEPVIKNSDGSLNPGPHGEFSRFAKNRVLCKP